VEIVDYLRIARRRVWVLLGIPLAAAIVTTLLVVLAPAQYSATATVSAPALIGGSTTAQYGGTQGVSQFVAAFQSTAQGPMVRQQVSDETKVASGKISNGITVAQVGASASMQVTYTSTKRSEIVPVLTAVTTRTLTQLFGSQVTLAQQQIKDATTDVTTANNAIVSWETKNGVVDPDQTFSSRQQQINSLESTQASLIANGKTSGSATIAAQIASLKASLIKLAPQMAQYDALTASRDAATASLTNAQNSLASARTQLGAANPSDVAYLSGEHPVSDGSQILTKVVPVVGAAIFAAIALVTILELLARSRTSEGSSDPSGETDGHAPSGGRKEEEHGGGDASADEHDAAVPAQSTQPAPSAEAGDSAETMAGSRY
jgi:hypothetical protein